MKIKQKSQVETEFQAQCRVIKWARVMAETGQEPRLAILHGDSSGVRVPVGLAVKMKLAGAIKGWPDLFLPVPYIGSYGGKPYYSGLFIELKRKKGGALSAEQKSMLDTLEGKGFQATVCHGADEAIETLKWYLKMP